MARSANALLPLRGAQANASQPHAHVWLSASAGTGKTHVLTARVFRLLLGGVPPENILCLTFTKAGASEMAERIHSRLAAWVQMSDADLSRDLLALGEDLGPEGRDAARQLFARVLEATGGGIRIQTIHSFCQQLLSSFPLEAGLVPGFRALEEREQQELARESLEELVIAAEEQGEKALLDALAALSLRLGEDEARRYLMECARAGDALAGLGGDIRGWLFATLDLPAGDIEAEIARLCGDDVFDVACLQRLARANAEWGTEKTGLVYADCISRWIASSSEERAATLPQLAACFLKKTDGLPKKVEKGQIRADADYQNLALQMADAISELVNLRTRAVYAEAAAQGLYAGRAYARAYAAAKRRIGVVDYDDLIRHAAGLLGSAGIAEWIRYKLDQRTDHILVDEAQDTNRSQWTIIAALVEEFFAGEGAKAERPRTLFTVGDYKQAIFGFQGTSPEAFADARLHFRALAREAGQHFHDLSLDESFRSTPALLEVVDAVVDVLGADALGLDPQAVHHGSARLYPGEVCLLKPISMMADEGDAEDAAPEGEEDWLSDQDRALAERIAMQIRDWLDGGMMLQSRGRPLRPGDVMILVRKRGDLARLIVARLYEAGVPVAGVDRLRLQAPLGVQDLMAALRFASQPQDDLNLANLLVSPLIGWSQQELMDRAVPRRGALWRHVRDNAATPPDSLATLQDILARADFITPYRMLEHILSGPMQGRRKLLERLGRAAQDSIDELLNAALVFEQQEQPSLQHFIAWFDSEEGEIKREDDGQADAVRLLTVHGAKGLQAPLVILADACADPENAQRGGRLDIPRGEGETLPFLAPRKAERWGIIDTAAGYQEALERQEHWRLLYVAMTRAEEKLFVTGALGPRTRGEVPEHSWFARIEQAMQGLGARWDADPLWNGVMAWQGREAYASAKPRGQSKEVLGSSGELPDWAFRAAPDEARPPRPLVPTLPGDDDTPYPPPSPALRDSARRGQLLHSLFERLPDVDPAKRREAADAWLARQGGMDDPQARAEWVAHVLRLIEDPAHAELFGPDSLAEAPVAAVVGEEVIQGVIDRLVIADRKVTLVDFKTGRHVPASEGEIPVPHLRQMAAYVAALETIFPERAVEASLLYTSGPVLFPLGESLLAPHKPGYAD